MDNLWNCLVVEPCWALPLWKYEFVNWDDYYWWFPIIVWENKTCINMFQTTNQGIKLDQVTTMTLNDSYHVWSTSTGVTKPNHRRYTRSRSETARIRRGINWKDDLHDSPGRFHHWWLPSEMIQLKHVESMATVVLDGLETSKNQ